MAQQTAVEWFEKNISKYISYHYDKAYEEHDEVTKIFEQAKAMEKEQMIGLLQWMNNVASESPMRLETDFDDIIEQYYNQTYNK